MSLWQWLLQDYKLHQEVLIFHEKIQMAQKLILHCLFQFNTSPLFTNKSTNHSKCCEICIFASICLTLKWFIARNIFFYFELLKWRVCFRFNFLPHAVFGILLCWPHALVRHSLTHVDVGCCRRALQVYTPLLSQKNKLHNKGIAYWVSCVTMASAISSTYWYTAAEREVTAPAREPQLRSRSARVHFSVVLHVRLTRKMSASTAAVLCFAFFGFVAGAAEPPPAGMNFSLKFMGFNWLTLVNNKVYAHNKTKWLKNLLSSDIESNFMLHVYFSQNSILTIIICIKNWN